MIHSKTRKRFFWIALGIIFLLSGGQTLVTSANNSSDLIISEFLAVNATGLTDEDGDYSDWIEIYNRGNLPVNLGGWSLTDDSNQPQKWPFPDMTLGSHEYLIVFASGKNRTSTEPGAVLHTNFKLSKTGEFLALHNILEDKFMDVFFPQYPEQYRDIAYGRHGGDFDQGYLNRPTPGAANDISTVQLDAVSPVQFSVERGFYDAPFEVELTSATTEATIRYTMDGSAPTETNGTVYAEPVPVDTTTLLRAAAFKPNFRPSMVDTHSYIFLDNVLSQPAVPSGLPVNRGAQLVASQGYIGGSLMAADYEMDPEVINNPQYKGLLKEGLKSIPAISLVMDVQSFDDLYIHTANSGQSSEQPVSVEFISPDGTEAGFQIHAGIRPHGSLETPKQSFRLLFKGKYGSTKLAYPLFTDSSVTEFDSLLLVDGGNDSFAGSTATDQNMTYTRSAWLRASQSAMSNLSAHDTYVHLYLNGLYWGLYSVVERPDSSFMASYLGSEKEDWFVADQGGPLGNNEGADRLDDLFTFLNLSRRVGGNPEQLAQIYTEVAASLDRAQFSDYLILSWYTGVEPGVEDDWYVGIRRQDVMGRRGKTIIGENTEIFKSDGLEMALGETDSYSISTTKALFDTLMQDPDFKMQLADRMYKHLFNDGALTDTNAQSRWQQLYAHIDQSILAELARWGDTNRETSPTREEWLQAGDGVLAQMDGNAGRLIAQAREAGYYPQFDPPTFGLDGGLVEAGFTVTMTLPPSCQDCIIYYTASGSDPRLPVTGEVMPDVVAYSTPVVLTSSTQLKARVFNPAVADTGQSWSALHEATFNVMEQDYKLRITEVMYNPIEGDDYEFVELKNVGDNAVDLANISIDEGIRFTFPPNTPLLAPDEFAVLVSNPVAFAERYPEVAISGAYEGHLSNKGEKIGLRDAEGQTLLEFTYNDENGWPVSADGRGDSLTLVNDAGDPNNPQNWRASDQLNGSPGAGE